MSDVNENTVELAAETAAETVAEASAELVAEPAPPVLEGYRFLGWFTDPGCSPPGEFASDTVSGSRTLYAGWTE